MLCLDIEQRAVRVKPLLDAAVLGDQLVEKQSMVGCCPMKNPFYSPPSCCLDVVASYEQSSPAVGIEIKGTGKDLIFSMMDEKALVLNT